MTICVAEADGFARLTKKVVDARDEPGHDGGAIIGGPRSPSAPE
jgi:hypothetical protein